MAGALTGCVHEPPDVTTVGLPEDCVHRNKINLSQVFAGQTVGITQVDDHIWLASFMHYVLGYIELEQRTLQTIDNPFGTRLSPMSQVQSVTHFSGSDNDRDGGEGGIRTPDTLASMPHFECGAFNRSATSPQVSARLRRRA